MTHNTFTRVRSLPLACARIILSRIPHTTSWSSILILFFHLCLGFQVVSFHQMSPPKPCTYLSCPSYVPHAPPISLLWWEVGLQNMKLLLNVAFSSLLLRHSSYGQIFSSVPYSRTPSAYVPPEMWENESHIFTKQQANYSSVYLDLYIFVHWIRIQKILHWMIADIPWPQSALNFFMN